VKYRTIITEIFFIYVRFFKVRMCRTVFELIGKNTNITLKTSSAVTQVMDEKFGGVN